jgi:hypothetical protein
VTRILQGAPFQLGAVALAVVLLAAGPWSRARDARRAERQAAERVAAYVASLTPEEVAEILAIDHGKSGESA